MKILTRNALVREDTNQGGQPGKHDRSTSSLPVMGRLKGLFTAYSSYQPYKVREQCGHQVIHQRVKLLHQKGFL